jgi:5'-3' exonuclease
MERKFHGLNEKTALRLIDSFGGLFISIQSLLESQSYENKKKLEALLKRTEFSRESLLLIINTFHLKFPEKKINNEDRIVMIAEETKRMITERLKDVVKS